MYTSNKPRLIKKGILIFLLVAAAVLGVGEIITLLWNAILPDLIHVNYITYWQSLGLLALCKILFGGPKFGNRGKHYGRHKWAHKYSNMSEEEKAAIKAKWKEHFGPKNN